MAANKQHSFNMTDKIQSYVSFLHDKIILAPETGFQVEENEINRVLLPQPF